MSVFSRISAIALLSAGLFVVAPASANLIVNGSFEDEAVAPGTWEFFSSADVNGWDGSNIEIWEAFNGVTAVDGVQFAELNAHPSPDNGPFGIFQSFDTTDGQWYDLSFSYRARQNNDEEFLVSVAGEDFEIKDHVTGSWSLFEGSFQAIGARTELRFTSVVPSSGTIGNFLDNVKVASVPEPGTLALLGLGLAGLGLRRRK